MKARFARLAAVDRPRVERLIGVNAQVVHQKVDRLHVATPLWTVYRQVMRPVIRKAKRRGQKSKRCWSRYSPELRRGLVLAIRERHAENWRTYRSVMSGRID